MGSMVRLALYATERLGAGDITRIIGANPPMTVNECWVGQMAFNTSLKLR